MFKDLKGVFFLLISDDDMDEFLVCLFYIFSFSFESFSRLT